jgi:hypothetical protein
MSALTRRALLSAVAAAPLAVEPGTQAATAFEAAYRAAERAIVHVRMSLDGQALEWTEVITLPACAPIFTSTITLAEDLPK